MLTNIVEAPRCQALWQTGCKKEACEQSAEEVVGMAGAQCLLPAAVGPAPAQLQLVREKRAAGCWAPGSCAWRGQRAEERLMESPGAYPVEQREVVKQEGVGKGRSAQNLAEPRTF